MAKSLVSHPWELNSGEDANKCVSDNMSIRNALTENMSAILKRLDLSDNFWTLLLQHGVVDTDTMRRIQAKKTQVVQAQTLMLHIMEVKVYKFHGFIWALVNSHQCHLAELLGFAVRDYLDVEVYFMSSALLCPACREFYTKAYILTGCGHYVCAPCVKGAQFMCKDNQKEDITCPVPECGIKTEACPTAGNIGLEEDGDFADLCQAVLNKTTKQSAGTTKETSTAKSKGKEGMATARSKEHDKLSQQLQGGISDLEKKISCLRKYRDVLGKYEPGVQDYITDEVEKVKQNVDEWAKETQGWYASIHKQVEKNFHKSVKWQKAASDLSVVVRARPGLLDECLKNKVHLPEETVTDAAEKLLTKLDAGCPIPPLLTPFPYAINPPTSVPPTKAEYLMRYELQHGFKVAWMPDSSLMVLTQKTVWGMELNVDKLEFKPTLIQRASDVINMSVAADGTWILGLLNKGIIEIHYPSPKEVKQWRPEGVKHPWHVYINKRNIFLSELNSKIIRSYSRDLMCVDEFNIGTELSYGDIHVAERGTLMKSSWTKSKIYTIDLETRETSSFGSKGKGDGELQHALGLCPVNDDDYILVCDYGNDHVSVFKHDGQFIHHLDVEGGIQKPFSVAVQREKPSLMALSGIINGKHVVGIYRLK